MAHYKRSMNKGNISPSDYCYQVVKRLSRTRPLRTAEAISCIERLTNKYSSKPKNTSALLIEQMFQFGPVGYVNGKVIYDEWEFALEASKQKRLRFCFIEQRRECFICHNHVPVKDQFDDEGLNYCPDEWCQRLYVFFYEENRPRPNLSKYGLRLTNVSSEVRFNFFLTEYLKRTADEKARA